MSGGGPSQQTTQKTESQLAPELRPLFSTSANRITGLQERAPLEPFLQPSPLEIAPLTQTQLKARSGFENLAGFGRPITEAPTIQAGKQAFENIVAPSIVNQATLAGLGRSTAVPAILQRQGAAFTLPLVEAELGRRERALGGLAGLGTEERNVAQAGFEAKRLDDLRRQAIAEEALFTPFGQLAPSGVTQQVTGKTTGGSQGLFK